MRKIDKQVAPTTDQIETFIRQIDFSLPVGFIEFFKGANGAYITTEESYISLWPLTEMFLLNEEYSVNEYAPEFFVFGSDGGDTAFAIEKSTGYIFEMPFIGMSNDEAIFKFKSFNEFINNP
jgi:hypothetical protein